MGMSAIGPKQTWALAPHMSAIRGKADMTDYRCLLLRSLLGVKRTWVAALHESAFDPKRTSPDGHHSCSPICYAWLASSLGVGWSHAPARFHKSCCWLS